ncbi:MAG TPA: hypothetical protein VFR34_08075 [Paracoccaceae bacterium]|nr:hypothetical protein [Paracoccaceae bacterium]
MKQSVPLRGRPVLAAPRAPARPKPLFPALALAAATLLPFLVGDFTIFQLTLVMVDAIAVLGLNLPSGSAGSSRSATAPSSPSVPISPPS